MKVELRRMTIYLVVVALILFAGITGSLFIKKRKTRDLIVVIFGFGLIYLLSCLKSTNVGSDTIAYLNGYETARNTGWNVFTLGNFEPGYVFISRLFAKIGIPFQGFLFFVYALIYFPLARFVYKYSPQVIMSVIVFTCFQFLNFHLSGLRQALAISIVLLSFDFILKKGKLRYLFFFVIIGIGMLFHRSIFIFFPAIFIAKIKIDIKNLFIVVMPILTLLLIFHYQVYAYAWILIPTLQEPGDYGTSGIFLAILFAVLVLAVVFRTNNVISIRIGEISAKLDNKLIKRVEGTKIFVKLRKFAVDNENLDFRPTPDRRNNDDVYRVSLVFLLVSVLFWIFGFDSLVSSRVGLYYLIFIIVLLPIVINYQKSIILRSAVYSFATITLTMLFIYVLKRGGLSMVPYEFFFMV